jgi:hypothetical protein
MSDVAKFAAFAALLCGCFTAAWGIVLAITTRSLRHRWSGSLLAAAGIAVIVVAIVTTFSKDEGACHAKGGVLVRGTCIDRNVVIQP